MPSIAIEILFLFSEKESRHHPCSMVMCKEQEEKVNLRRNACYQHFLPSSVAEKMYDESKFGCLI